MQRKRICENYEHTAHPRPIWRTAHQIKNDSMPKIFEINLNTVLFIGFNIWNLTKQTACCPRIFIKKGLHQILRIRPIKHHNRYHLLVTCKMTGDWTYPLEKTKQYHKHPLHRKSQGQRNVGHSATTWGSCP